jgi:Flp pilus assembly protein TadG
MGGAEGPWGVSSCLKTGQAVREAGPFGLSGAADERPAQVGGNVLDPRCVRGRRPDDGAAAVEFALVSILLFLLLFGIIEFGIGFFTQQGAAAAAREAARRAIVGSVKTCNTGTGNTDLLAIIKRAGGSASTFFDTPSLTTIDTNGNGVVGDVGDDVKVTVKYHVGLPFISALVPGVPSNLANLTQTGTARIESQGSVTTC